MKQKNEIVERIERIWDFVHVELTGRGEAIQHLKHHLELGHCVSEDAISRLENEIKLLGDKVQPGVTPLKAKYMREGG